MCLYHINLGEVRTGGKKRRYGKDCFNVHFALHCQIHVQVCCFVQGKMYMMPIVKYRFINENFIHDLSHFFADDIDIGKRLTD